MVNLLAYHLGVSVLQIGIKQFKPFGFMSGIIRVKKINVDSP